MIWVWTVSLPVTILNSPAITGHPSPAFGTGADIAGIILFALGFSLEAVADAQKYRFRSTVQAADKSAVCDKGVWAFSRHPNYFGEIVTQFAIYLTAVSPAAYPGRSGVHGGARAALYASVVGPCLLTGLLLFVSGLTLQERPGAKKRYERSVDGENGDEGREWEAYERYLNSVSILIPMPKSVWRTLPVWVKRTVGCEWPMYVFVPERDSDVAQPA